MDASPSRGQILSSKHQIPAWGWKSTSLLLDSAATTGLALPHPAPAPQMLVGTSAPSGREAHSSPLKASHLLGNLTPIPPRGQAYPEHTWTAAQICLPWMNTQLSCAG